MADQDTNWTWNFTGPTTESKAQSRAILPKEIAWELTGVDGNEVGGLRTHPGFKNICTFTTGSETLVNVFPLALLTSAEAFVCGHIYFTTTGGNTRGYIQVTSDGSTYNTSPYTADLMWTGTGLEITVECIGRFAYIFVKGQNPKSLRITNVAVGTVSNFVVQDGGPGTAPDVAVISIETDDKNADYLNTTKNPAGSRNGTGTYNQDLHVYRAGGAVAAKSGGYGALAYPTLGTGATAGTVVSTTIQNGGLNYNTVPTVTFSSPPSGITATGVAVIGSFTSPSTGMTFWSVKSITITNAGSGYGTTNPTITFNSPSVPNLGSGIKLPIGDYSFAVQYMSTVTGRKSVISNVKILKVKTNVNTTTATPSSTEEEYLRLKVFNFGTSNEYDKALIYRSVKNAGEGGTLHLEKTLSLPAASTIYSVTQATTIVTIVTVAAHGLQVGDFVTVAAATSTAINGSFAIASITNSTTFTYTTTSGTITTTPQGGSVTLKVRNYDVEVPDMELVYLDVYIDKGNMDKTMPRGSVAAFMGSTLFVSRIGGADVATPDDITPQSPPRAIGDLRWSSTGEIQPENFRPSNRWIPRTPGNEIIGMRTVGNYMMAFSADRTYRIGRAGQFIKVEEVHLGYGLAGVDALEGVGGMVYFVSGGGVKAISAEGKIDDVAGLDALVNRLWLSQKSQIKMAFDAIGQCLTIMKPPTALNAGDGAAVCMWFGTNRITELTDLPFYYVRSGSCLVNQNLQRRALFFKRESLVSWGVYIVDHERTQSTGKNLCGGTARLPTYNDFVFNPVTSSDMDCVMYEVVTGDKKFRKNYSTLFMGSISGTILTVTSNQSSLNENSISVGMRIPNFYNDINPLGTKQTLFSLGPNLTFFVQKRNSIYPNHPSFSCVVESVSAPYYGLTTKYPTWSQYKERPTTSVTFTKIVTNKQLTDVTSNGDDNVLINTTAAIDTTGRVWAWGNNKYNQCNVHSSALSGVIDVSVGLNHIVAIKADGSVVAWGDNSVNQCTPLPTMTGWTPVKVVSSSYVNLILATKPIPGGIPPHDSYHVVPPVYTKLFTWGNDLGTGQKTFQKADPTATGWDTKTDITFLADPTNPAMGTISLTNELQSNTKYTYTDIYAGPFNFGVLNGIRDNEYIHVGSLVVWGSSILNTFSPQDNPFFSYTSCSLGAVHALALLNSNAVDQNIKVVSWGLNVDECCTIPDEFQGNGTTVEVQAHSFLIRPQGLTGAEPRINNFPYGNTTATTGNFISPYHSGFSVFRKQNNTIKFIGWGSEYFNSFFSGLTNITKIFIDFNVIYNNPADVGIVTTYPQYDNNGKWIWEITNPGASGTPWVIGDIPTEGLHFLSMFINIQYLTGTTFNLANLSTRSFAIEDKPIKPGDFLYYGNVFNFSSYFLITQQLTSTTYRISLIGQSDLPANSSISAWDPNSLPANSDTKVLSVAPMLFRWVGGNVGSQADPAQPEFKDFFRQKQLSSCQTYFEVISTGTLPSTYATWRALAYRGTEETPLAIGVPTNQIGEVVNTFSTAAASSGTLHNAPFGRHGVMWSSLSVGFQCDIVGVDLRLLAFNSIGRVLDTTRRYV